VAAGCLLAGSIAPCFRIVPGSNLGLGKAPMKQAAFNWRRVWEEWRKSGERVEDDYKISIQSQSVTTFQKRAIASDFFYSRQIFY
jgi:hypothetical protein